MDTTGSNLLLILGIDISIQLLFFIPSYYFQTEKFYDLSGSLTYLACVLIGLLVKFNGLIDLHPRQIIATVGVCVGLKITLDLGHTIRFFFVGSGIVCSGYTF